MIKPFITILIVNFNTADFILNSLNCLNKITKNPYLVHILDNGSNESDFQKLTSGIYKFPNVFLRRRHTTSKGSVAHGEALNMLTKKITTPYFCILDPDAVWLKKNWDEFLIKELNKKIKAIGTPRTSSDKENFPAVYAMLLETKTFKQLKPDFLPSISKANQDTGWQLEPRYRNAGFKAKVFLMKNTRDYKNGPFKNIICAEYYFNNQIIASHFSRGSTLGSAKYNSFLYKIPLAGNWFKRWRGTGEKNDWINTSQKFVQSF